MTMNYSLFHCGKPLPPALGEKSVIGFVDRYYQNKRVPPLLPLSEYITRRVTSTSNLDFRMLFVGSPGAGKSWAALSLAEQVAERLATHLGKPKKNFFSKKNIIYGTPEEVFKSINGITQYGVYVIDDMGVSMNSRRFATETNIWFSSVFQTCRTDNAVILMTAPDPFLIDKVPRSLIHCFAEMYPGDYHSSSNFRLAKVFTISKNFRIKKTYFKYPKAGNLVYTAYRFSKPSLEVINVYEKFRSTIAKKAKLMLKPRTTKNSSVASNEQEGRQTERLRVREASPIIYKIHKDQNVSIHDATEIYNRENGTKFHYRDIYLRLYRQRAVYPLIKKRDQLSTEPAATTP